MIPFSEKFQTSLREVLGYIKYAKNKDKLKEHMADNPRMVMETMAAQVIKEITHTAIQIPEEEEKIDMCQAVDEMIKEGEVNGFLKAYVDLVKGGVLSVKEASVRTNLTEKEFIEKMGKLSEINPYLSKKGVH